MILENVFVDGIDRYKKKFASCTKLDYMGVKDSILTFEAFEALEPKYFPFYENEDISERYDNKFGLMYRPIFQREGQVQYADFEEAQEEAIPCHSRMGITRESIMTHS
jgi:hypothetical protein